MWRQINLLGRDRVLSEKIRPRLREKRGFLLTGQHGIGKTALLEWSAEQAVGKVAFVSATWTVKEIMMAICLGWKLEIKNNDGVVVSKSKYQVAWMEQEILQQSGCWLFVDDIHLVQPSVIRRLKILRDRCHIVAAGVPPFKKEELRRLLWGLADIRIKPLPKAELTRIATLVAPLVASRTPVPEAVNAARGNPGQLMHAMRGEVTPDTAKVKGEEIDISPVLMLVLVCVMCTRYIAIGLESTSLYMLGGLGMGLGLVFRFFLFKGMKT
ncbi:MAG TPA: ATP-binding protein [Desulfocapsa sulfexigens]|nr:ATP-binding protein [Desulfocapsa sulfexigens]